ncbi:MAG: cupin domain-containing protein [Pseudomonadota bacterium]
MNTGASLMAGGAVLYINEHGYGSEDGTIFQIRAGDSVYFDENSRGTWEILETARKTYLTFKRG